MKNNMLSINTKVILRDAMGNIKLSKNLHKNEKPEKQNSILATIRSKSGIILKEIPMKMDSFVANRLRTLYGMLSQTQWDSYRYDTGVLLANTTSSWGGHSNGANAVVGIRVGTGNTAISTGDYRLDGSIDHGTGIGQLNCDSNIFSGVSIDGNFWKWTIARVFQNNSGNTINIQNIGIVGHSPGATLAESGLRMVCRDITNKNGIPINIELANEQSVEFTFTIYYSFSEGILHPFVNMECAFYRNLATGMSYVDTDGDTISAINLGSNVWQWNAGAGISTWGFQVGTGNTPPTMNDYKLDSPIVHGTGVGQMTYNAFAMHQNIIEIGNVTSFAVKRTFVNNSAALITVRETGWVHQSNLSTNRFIGFRKLTGNIPVGVGEPIEIITEIQTVS